MKRIITILSFIALAAGIIIIITCLDYWKASLSVTTSSSIIALVGGLIFSAGLISLALLFSNEKKWNTEEGCTKNLPIKSLITLLENITHFSCFQNKYDFWWLYLYQNKCNGSITLAKRNCDKNRGPHPRHPPFLDTGTRTGIVWFCPRSVCNAWSAHTRKIQQKMAQLFHCLLARRQQCIWAADCAGAGWTWHRLSFRF